MTQWDTRGDAFRQELTKVGPGGHSRSAEALTKPGDGQAATGQLAQFRGFGRCDCNEFHEGVACEHKKCPISNTQVCGGSLRGVCDQKTGRCMCNHGYWETDCSMG